MSGNTVSTSGKKKRIVRNAVGFYHFSTSNQDFTKALAIAARREQLKITTIRSYSDMTELYKYLRL